MLLSFLSPQHDDPIAEDYMTEAVLLALLQGQIGGRQLILKLHPELGGARH